MVTYSPVNNEIEINSQEYFNIYKDIIKTCIEDGYVLPYLLEEISVPEEYNYAYEETKKFARSVEAYRKYHQMDYDRELRYCMIEVPFSDYERWCEEYVKIENEELLEFIATYPEYEKILK